MMLTARERDAFLIEHVVLRSDGGLARRSGHFANKPIIGSRFLVAGRQFDTTAVVQLLKTGQWPSVPNPRNASRRNGPRTKEARRIADEKLFALMRERPKAGLRQLAALLGVTHPVLSRRIQRLKTKGLAERSDEGWEVTAPVKCAKWVLPLSAYQRQETLQAAGARFG
jgi:hypothetical protein